MSLIFPSTPRIYHREGMPVAWFPCNTPRTSFGGDDGGGDVYDLCGNTPAGERNGAAVYAPGPFGNALSFKQSTPGYVDIPKLSLPAEAESASLSAWLKDTGNYLSDNSGSAPLQFGASGSDSWFPYNDGNIYLGVLDTNRIIVVSGASIDFSQWNHLCVTTSPGTNNYVVYINGARFISATRTALSLGPDCRIGSATYTGLISNVQIYDYAISPAQVAREYADPLWRLRRPRRRSWLVGSTPTPTPTGIFPGFSISMSPFSQSLN